METSSVGKKKTKTPANRGKRGNKIQGKKNSLNQTHPRQAPGRGENGFILREERSALGKETTLAGGKESPRKKKNVKKGKRPWGEKGAPHICRKSRCRGAPGERSRIIQNLGTEWKPRPRKNRGLKKTIANQGKKEVKFQGKREGKATVSRRVPKAPLALHRPPKGKDRPVWGGGGGDQTQKQLMGEGTCRGGRKRCLPAPRGIATSPWKKTGGKKKKKGLGMGKKSR